MLMRWQARDPCSNHVFPTNHEFSPNSCDGIRCLQGKNICYEQTQWLALTLRSIHQVCLLWRIREYLAIAYQRMPIPVATLTFVVTLPAKTYWHLKLNDLVLPKDIWLCSDIRRRGMLDICCPSKTMIEEQLFQVALVWESRVTLANILFLVNRLLCTIDSLFFFMRERAISQITWMR